MDYFHRLLQNDTNVQSRLAYPESVELEPIAATSTESPGGSLNAYGNECNIATVVKWDSTHTINGRAYVGAPSVGKELNRKLK